MNLTPSFLSKNVILVIGQHLLLSFAHTVVKTAGSVFAHRPNPTQEGSRDAFSTIISRCRTRSVEE